MKEGDYFHKIYKVCGKWIQNKLDRLRDDGSPNYYVILVDDQLVQLKNQGAASSIMSEVNVDQLDV